MTVRGRMRRASIVLLLGLAVATLTLASAAAADCEFVLGFKTLRDLIGHEIVGECVENEKFNENGDSAQRTTGGHFFWGKAENITSFTDGHHTWIYGRFGLQYRLNTERFPWESDYVAPVDDSSASPQPIAVPGPSDTSSTPPVVPLPPPITPEEDVLPLPPAPSYVSLSSAHDLKSTGERIRIDAAWRWPKGIEAIRLGGDVTFQGVTVKRDDTDGDGVTISRYVCTADKAEQELQINVSAWARGDGERYQAGWSPSISLKLTVTCPKETAKLEPTPTPDPTLPFAPAPHVAFSTRSVDSGGHTIEVIVTVDNPAPHGSITWYGPTDFTLFEIEDSVESHRTYICGAEDAGQLYQFRVVASARGNGVEYLDIWGVKTDTSFSYTCPTSAVTVTPAPSGLPYAPAPWVSINTWIVDEYFYVSSNRPYWSIDANIVWPDSVTKIEYIFEGGGGRFTSTEGRSFTKSTVVCLPSEGGTTKRFQLVARAFGDGVTYHADYGPWSSSAGRAVVCTSNLPAFPILEPEPTPIVPYAPAPLGVP